MRTETTARTALDNAVLIEADDVSNDMSRVTENESWIVDRGAVVLRKSADVGPQSVTSWKQLFVCLWNVDYMMRNAGDLSNLPDIDPYPFSNGRRLADELRLCTLERLFDLSPADLETRYFEHFEEVCAELRAAELTGS